VGSGRVANFKSKKHTRNQGFLVWLEIQKSAQGFPQTAANF